MSKNTRSNSQTQDVKYVSLDEDSLNAIVGKIIPKLDKTSGKLDEAGINAIVGKLEPKINKMIEVEMNRLTENMNEQLSAVMKKLAPIEQMTHKNTNQISILSNKYDELEQKAKMKSLRISGLEDELGENLLEKLLKFMSENLQINCSSSEISNVYRIGNGNDRSKPRTIIVDFVTAIRRNEVFRAKGLLKGKKIFINEDLTDNRYKLQVASKKVCGNDVWTRYGRIFTKHGNVVKMIEEE